MSKTYLKITHTEYLNDSHSEIGVILCFDESYNILNKTTPESTESYCYFFKNDNYIIFKTLANLFDFMIYGDTKTNRAYLSEAEFDELYDANGFKGSFDSKLEWSEVIV